MALRSSGLGRGTAAPLGIAAAAQGTLLVLVSATGFGAMAIFAKVAYAAGANVQTTLFLRFLLASAALWAGLAVTGQARVALPPRTIAACAALGAVGYATMSLVFFSALEYIPASLASLVLYTYPPIVTLLAVVFLREGLDLPRGAALGVASIGLVLVLGVGGRAAGGVGVALALAASLSYSGYIVAARVLLRDVPPFAASAIVVAAAGVTFGVYGVASGTLRLALPAPAYAAIAGMAVVSTAVAIGAFFAGLRRVGASRAAILSTFEPVVTLVLAVMVLKEHLAPIQLIGGACILGAVVLLHVRRGPRAGAASPAAIGAPERNAPPHGRT